MDKNDAISSKDLASNSSDYNSSTNECRKRKSSGPSHSKPEPESSKQSIKLTADQEMVQIPNTANCNNSVTSNADATIAENGSDNDKSPSRPKRIQKKQKITNFNFKAKEIEDDELVTLENDQMKHLPQHESEKEEVKEPTKSSDKKSIKIIELFEDQNRYPPQHTPESAEDFKANKETIEYFLEVLMLKREKYDQLNLKAMAAYSFPLSLAFGKFIQYYWPGMLNCCGQVVSKCTEFHDHISAHHGSEGKALKPTVLTDEVPVVRMDANAMERSPSISPSPQFQSNQSSTQQ